MPENTCVMYKNKPLVRNNNVICYGYPTDKAVLILTAFMTRNFEGSPLVSGKENYNLRLKKRF